MRSRYLAWGLWLLFVGVLVTATYYGLNPPDEKEPIGWVDALWAWSFLGFPTTGALIASRFPDRPLGWLFCTGPLFIMAGVVISDVAIYSGAAEGGEQWYALVSNVMFSAGLATFFVVPFFLPDGYRARGVWMDRLFRVIQVCIGVWIANALFGPGPLQDFPEYTNPLGIEALEKPFDALQAVLGPVILLAASLGLLSIVVRFRRSEGHARLQLKWIAVGAAIIPLALAVGAILEIFVDLGDVPVTLLTTVAICALPVSIGIAMLRHQLYEIDQVINRALVYAILTAFLVAAYLGLVVALQTVVDSVANAADSDLAVAASTLAVAALFRPLRSRTQAFIDRRFYRSKYNAVQALAGFGARTREEVDLDTLQQDIVGVVQDTVQPVHATVWLRQGTAG